MSFYIRKSVKFGPVRLNFSKSGIGVSAGIKGARISTGPRGTYIHMGRNGIYYRQKIDGSLADTRVSDAVHSDSAMHFEAGNGNTPAADTSDLVDSSTQNLLSQINSRIQEPTYAFRIGILSAVIAVAIASLAYVVKANAGIFLESAYPYVLALPLVVGALTLIAGLSVAHTTHQQEILARTTTLLFEFDGETKDRFTATQKAFANLAKSACIWHVTSEAPNWDWKRNAGASSIITRKRIAIQPVHPPFIKIPFEVYGVLLDSIRLFFLPDQVLILQNGKYGAIGYDTLQVHALPTRFIEDGGVPNDSTVIDHTWQYVRKDGGPDLRFRNNRLLPVVQYGHVQIIALSGVNLHLHISNLSNAQQFAQAINEYIRHRQKPSQNSSSRTTSGYQQSSAYQQEERPKTKAPKDAIDENPYDILNVSPHATRDEITTAYRKLGEL